MADVTTLQNPADASMASNLSRTLPWLRVLRALHRPVLSVRRELDYYCRLDTDSRINAPLRDDIFDYMADNQLHYGRVVSALPELTPCIGSCEDD